jgi:tRNA(Ile)-lysidine synthase
LSAQHQDDQAETLLLQLLRGSGVKGLAAMPSQSVLGAGFLVRPLLGFSRRALLDYAAARDLCWVEDPSNRDVGLDRNYLRRRVVPELRRRWPAMAESISRSARHCAEAAAIMEQLARDDVAELACVPAGTLRVSGLQALSADRQRNALRYWLRKRAANAPSTAVLTRMVHDLLGSRRDAGPCVRWEGFEARRYRDRLYLLRQKTAPLPGEVLEWDVRGPLELPHAGGMLTAISATGQGLRADAVSRGRVQVRFRQGGERCRPAGRRHHHLLKKLFQENAIPPWERTRIPLIYIDNALAAVADCWDCEPFAAVAGEPGLVIQWQRGVHPD